MRSVTNKRSVVAGTERSGRSGFFLAAMLFFLCLAAPACAGMVSGVVRNEKRPQPGIRVELRDSRGSRYVATTNSSGRYNVNLPPGLYKATIPGNRQVLILQSSSQPSRQDLNFGGR